MTAVARKRRIPRSALSRMIQATGALDAFQVDPFGAARAVILREVAEAAIGTARSTPTHDAARQVVAFHGLCNDAAEDELSEQALTAQIVARRLAAAEPSHTRADVGIKLAVLVRSLLNRAGASAPPEEHVLLSLAAGALADLLILGDDPIRLPERATDRIFDQADVDHWRARAEALA